MHDPIRVCSIRSAGGQLVFGFLLRGLQIAEFHVGESLKFENRLLIEGR